MFNNSRRKARYTGGLVLEPKRVSNDFKTLLSWEKYLLLVTLMTTSSVSIFGVIFCCMWLYGYINKIHACPHSALCIYFISFLINYVPYFSIDTIRDFMTAISCCLISTVCTRVSFKSTIYALRLSSVIIWMKKMVLRRYAHLL